MTAPAQHAVGDVVKARGFSTGDRWCEAVVREVVRTGVGIAYKVSFRTAGYGRAVRWAEVRR